MLRKIISKDGVRLALYEYGQRRGPASGDPNIIFSHATGFHGRVFDSIISMLPAEYRCISMDHRGHGQSGWNPNRMLRWEQFGEDLLEVSHSAFGTSPAIGVGHSMGGTALIMAALAEPKKFSALLLYEPIVFPMEMRLIFHLMGDSPLATMARKRRKHFRSHEEAIANFSKKPPMSSFDPDVLRNFVLHGIAPKEQSGGVESNEGTGSLHLRCDRDIEAEVYNAARNHLTWNELHNLSVPTWIISGKLGLKEPSLFAKRLAGRIPNAKFIRWGDAGHFGPFEKPARLAEMVVEVVLAVR